MGFVSVYFTFITMLESVEYAAVFTGLIISAYALGRLIRKIADGEFEMGEDFRLPHLTVIVPVFVFLALGYESVATVLGQGVVAVLIAIVPESEGSGQD